MYKHVRRGSHLILLPYPHRPVRPRRTVLHWTMIFMIHHYERLTLSRSSPCIVYITMYHTTLHRKGVAVVHIRRHSSRCFLWSPLVAACGNQPRAVIRSGPPGITATFQMGLRRFVLRRASATAAPLGLVRRLCNRVFSHRRWSSLSSRSLADCGPDKRSG